MALNWSGLAIYMPVLFGLFYLGYLLALKLFYQFGYHPRPEPVELGGYRATLSLPVFIAVTPEFASLRRAISRRVRFLQLLFNLIKLIFLLALIYEVGYLLQHLTNYIQIGFLAVVAILIFAINPILIWFFKRLFRLDVIAKEYGRPLFNNKLLRS
ncbi:hypothetical protein ACFQ4L_03205 [Lapidilactobacillus mulanensis]|uniref:Uncharacterized protein n=1 Tax=Lapidilactobacillus mulanensis TaxID=2485999 RepID=A0ABW4DKE8_9LACO|nr:hypothetical protein [Lapidilactobacillus mulanensis]